MPTPTQAPCLDCIAPLYVHGVVCRSGKGHLKARRPEVSVPWPDVVLLAEPQVRQHGGRPTQLLGSHECHTELGQLLVDELEVGEDPCHGPRVIFELWGWSWR